MTNQIKHVRISSEALKAREKFHKHLDPNSDLVKIYGLTDSNP